MPQHQTEPDVTPRVEVLPYILDPRLTSSSKPPPSDIYETDATKMIFATGSPPTKDVYYAKKFPIPGQLETFDGKINEAAKELGMGQFVFSGPGHVGATWDSQRLISKAGEVERESLNSTKPLSGLQNKVSKRLYSDFHIDSRDVSNHDVLAQAGVDFEVFPDLTAAKKFLSSDDHDDTLRFKLQQAEMNGVRSVPFYIVNDGADHLSQTGTKEEFMRMFRMAVRAFV